MTLPLQTTSASNNECNQDIEPIAGKKEATKTKRFPTRTLDRSKSVINMKVTANKIKKKQLSRRDSHYGKQRGIDAAMQLLLNPGESIDMLADHFHYKIFLGRRIYYWLVILGILPTQKCPLALKIWWTCTGVIMFLVSIFYIIPLVELLACGVENSCVVNKQQGPAFGMTVSSPAFAFAWLLYPVNLWIASRIMQGRKMKLLWILAAHGVQSSFFTTVAFVFNILAIVFPCSLLVVTIMIYDDKSEIQPLWIAMGIISCICLPALLGITVAVAVIADAMTAVCDDLVLDLARTRSKYPKCVPQEEEARLLLRYHEMMTCTSDVTRRLSPVFFFGIPCSLITAVTLAYVYIHSDSDNTSHIFGRYLYQFQTILSLAVALPLFVALAATETVSVVERAVNLVPFENQRLCEFVARGEHGWQISMHSRSSTTFSKSLALVVLGLGTFFSFGFESLVTFQQDQMSPVWYTDGYTEQEGSCHDGFWNGHEQFVDCGGLCPRSCASVHGDYLLLPQYGTRYNSDGVANFTARPTNCEDIDGYTDIHSQKECEVAHWIWSSPRRKKEHSGIVRPVEARILMAETTMPADTNATITSLLACGAHLKRPALNTRATLSFFPALFPKNEKAAMKQYNLVGYHYFVGEWPNRATAYLCIAKNKSRALLDRESVCPAKDTTAATASSFRLIPQEWSALIAPYTSMTEEYLTRGKTGATDHCTFVSKDCVAVSAAATESPPAQGFACRWVVHARHNGTVTLSIKFERADIELPYAFPPLLHLTDTGRHSHQIVGYDQRTTQTRVSGVSPGSLVDYFLDARAKNAPRVTICVER